MRNGKNCRDADTLFDARVSESSKDQESEGFTACLRALFHSAVRECKLSFTEAFNDLSSFQDVHETIVNARLFERGEKVAIGASGGKDSTVLAYVMKVSVRLLFFRDTRVSQSLSPPKLTFEETERVSRLRSQSYSAVNRRRNQGLQGRLSTG